MEKVLKNGYIALPNEKDFVKRDIRIKDGKIIEINENIESDEFLDLNGLHVFPGGIDPHVHFDEPGFTQREDFYHGSSAAASGGITTVIDMPCTSLPPVTNLKNLKSKLSIVEKKSVVDFAFYGGISSQSFKNNYQKSIQELKDYVVGFKTYFISGMETFGDLNLFQFEQTLIEAKKINKVILLHAEDKNYVENATKFYKTKEDSYRNYYNSRPEIAEKLAIQNAISLAEKHNSKLHIVHLGIGDVLHLIKDNISAETCPHYLEFDNHDLENIGSPLKVAPCLKGSKNRSELWKGLKNGKISFVASDHAPAPYEGKYTDSVWSDYSGIPGSGTLFPYLLSEGFLKDRISLKRTLELISENAAKRFSLFDRKGSIEIGKDADFAIFDLEKYWTVEGKKFLSKGKITPFEGKKFKGKLIFTILRGEKIYSNEDSILVEKGYGDFLKPSLF